jgi:hypothetical protein
MTLKPGKRTAAETEAGEISAVPMFDKTIIFDLDENKQVALITGQCPMPAGGLVVVLKDGKPREFRVVRTRLQVSDSDATLLIDCRSPEGA